MRKLIVLFVLCLGFSTDLCASQFEIPQNGDDIVGEIKQVTARRGDNLYKIARRNDIGYYEIKDANQNLDPNKPLQRGIIVNIPSRFILPGDVREGIVINLSELRIYYYLPNSRLVMTEPIGIGKIGWLTPVGRTKIIEKRKHPTWRPPAAVREDALKHGIKLPDIMPAGPDNPLGDHMMRLGWYSYLIHGTNKPEGVGKRVTSGCILMYPEDIKKIFPLVPVGTQVVVMDKPIKVGHQGTKLFVEVHKPLIERGGYDQDDSINLVEELTKKIAKLPANIQWKRALKAIKRETGIPTIVGQYVENKHMAN